MTIIHPINPMLRFDHRLFILEEVPKNSVCAEVGVFEGTFSQHIIIITKPKKLHLIDPWVVHGSWETFNKNKEYFEECDYEINKQRFEDTKFKDSYFDWIYLDNGHKFTESYEQLKLAYKKVKSGGLIIGDDYRSEHQSQKVAVDIFVKLHKVEWIKTKNFQFKIRKL